MSAPKEYHKIRTGVIGVGSMGQNHARIYNEVSSLVGVADLDESKGCEISNRLGVPYFKDYRDLLDKIDAVSVAAPTAYHKEISLNVCKAGVHLLVEKPLANNTADANAIVEAARSNGLKLAVGHIERHNKAVSHAKKCIENGEWGEIISISSKRFSNFPERIKDVNVLYDLAIHDIDVMNYLVGDEVYRVFAVGGKSKNEKFEDYVNISIEYKNKVLGLCESNWITPMKLRQLFITSTSHYVILDYQSQKIRLLKSEFKNVPESNLYQTKIDFTEDFLDLGGKEPLKLEIEDFLGTVNNSRDPLCTGSQGVVNLKIMDSAQKSMETGEIVIINEIN